MNIEEIKERICKDPKLMRECLNEHDFAGFLTCSYSPMDNDDLEFGQRVREFIGDAVTAHAEWMMREEEEINDTAEDERLDDPRRGQAEAINAGRF